MGQTIASKLIELGHDVMIGTRNVDKLLVKSEPDNFGRPPFKVWHQSNQKVKLASLDETAGFGEFLVNAMQGHGTLSALEKIDNEKLAGKVLLDISNPLDFSQGFPPSLTVCNTDSLGEQIQRGFPGLKVVKSLNTMNAYIMVNPRVLPENHTVFLSGNDSDAKESVRQLLQSFGWKNDEILDLGDITTARGSEQILPIWARIYSGVGNPMFNIKIVFGQNPSA